MNIRHELITANWSDFPTRVVTALIGAPLVIIAIVVGAPLFDVLVWALAGLAAVELHRMMRPAHRFGQVAIFGGVFATIALVAYFPAHMFMLPLLLALLALGSAIAAHSQTQDAQTVWIENSAYPVLGVLYVALPLAFLLVIRSSADGLLWIMALTWNVWATDTMALVGGRLIGRHKLAPHISPGKTIEGALVGMVFGITISVLILVLGGVPTAVAMSIGASLSGMAVIGDLFESWLKRHFNVKDAGSILPGHGGVLDRIDGVLGAAPIFYLLLLAFGVL